MAYKPQPGNQATLKLAPAATPANALHVMDIEFAMEQTAIESTILTNIYKTFIRGRFSGRITATLAATADDADFQRTGLVQQFLSQTVRGSAVFMTIEDAGGFSGGTSQSYVTSGIVTSCTHTMRGDEIDTLRIEFQVSGQYD